MWILCLVERFRHSVEVPIHIRIAYTAYLKCMYVCTTRQRRTQSHFQLAMLRTLLGHFGGSDGTPRSNLISLRGHLQQQQKQHRRYVRRIVLPTLMALIRGAPKPVFPSNSITTCSWWRTRRRILFKWHTRGCDVNGPSVCVCVRVR